MAPRNTTQVLVRLRALMKQKCVAAYIVPTEDEHLGEACSHDETRRSYISGFSGSRGVAIVTDKSAALWTDGRYFLQAEREIDNNWLLMKEALPETPEQYDWLGKELPDGGDVGIDPFLIPTSTWTTFTQKLANFDLTLVGVVPNLVDEIWEGKPPRPTAPIFVHPLNIAGKSWQDKVRDVQKKLVAKKAAAVVVTQLDDIAWLLNLRGSDIDCLPCFYSYVIVDQTDLHLFIDESRLDETVRTHLGLTSDLDGDSGIKVHTHKYDSIQTFLADLASSQTNKIWISEESSQALVNCVPVRKRLNLFVPIAEMKAVKNQVEIAAMRRAHIKDAVSLCEFFVWLEKEVPNGKVTEVSAANQLDAFKRLQDGYMGKSFDFISSVGANGSVIHYRPTPETDTALNTDEIYLNDTGAQFREGTTDVTRCLHFGTPTNFEKECFTRVLKGHIAISCLVFPERTRGGRLDSFARQALWEQGLDYLHGTGHGVGQFLNVHEGPYGINARITPGELNLQENMIVSNEPGYYEDGKFGVRIESLVQVVKANTPHNYRGKQFFTFDELTLVPLQLKMIDKSLLTQKEIDWVNKYHERCRDVIGAELKSQGKTDINDWLVDATQHL